MPLGDDEQDSSAVPDAIFLSLAYKEKERQNIYSFLSPFSFLLSRVSVVSARRSYLAWSP
jgi:hypothetical protein